MKGVSYADLKASILVDAGGVAKDEGAIKEGVGLFRKLLKELPDNAQILYNLGNGLLALAAQKPYTGNNWYLETAAIRREARSSLKKALSAKNNEPIVSQAFTNLGNSLFAAHRWVEAYDAYSNALQQDPSNAIASTGAARILLGCIQRRLGDKDILKSLAARYLKSANLHSKRLAELAGPRALKQLADLLKMNLPAGTPESRKRHRL